MILLIAFIFHRNPHPIQSWANHLFFSPPISSSERFKMFLLAIVPIPAPLLTFDLSLLSVVVTRSVGKNVHEKIHKNYINFVLFQICAKISRLHPTLPTSRWGSKAS